MRTRNTSMKHFAMATALVVLATAFPVDAVAQQVECTSVVRKITGVTNPAGHVITTKYQFDNPNLQPLLTTTIDRHRVAWWRT